MRTALILIVASAALLSVSPRRAQADVTDAQVRDAIDKAVKYIYSEQGKWGHWDVQTKEQGKGHAGVQYSGWTALACYALLSAGEDWQNNPKMESALKFLAKSETEGAYALGLRCHVWPKLPDSSKQINFMKELEEDLYKLLEGLNASGAYHYAMGASSWDNSTTQYGVLGVWEGAKRGFAEKVSREYWQKVEGHFLQTQNADGGWSYHTGASKQSMSAAGMAVLFITQDYLHSAKYDRPGVWKNVEIQKRIQRGLEWFDKNFNPTTNGYEMVGVERVGVASGYKFFNKKDWYQAGATALIRSQKNGAMGSGPGGGIVPTAFSVVFLTRGRVPVFMNKLEIADYDWNNRPRDVANVTAWAANEFELPMNWQVVDLSYRPEQWLDAPVLYLASHEKLPFESADDPNFKKIVRFINLGGTLVTTADAGSRAFTDSVVRLFEQAYDGMKFKRVSNDDHLYNVVYQLRDQKLMSLHNGIRHMVIHIPQDVSSSFQRHNMRDEDKWKLMGNIFQYAVEKMPPRPKLARHFVAGAGGGPAVNIGKVKYDGAWNPEPLAWQRLSAATDKATFNAQPVELAKFPDGVDVSMLHLIGSEPVQLTEAEVESIKRFVADGGTVLVEAAGGDIRFLQAMQGQLRKAFPDGKVGRLPTTSPIITGAGINGYDCTRVNYRTFYRQKLGFANRPFLQAMTIDGKPSIILSAEDITGGLIGARTWGVFGYSNESAQHLMANICLYAAKQKPAEGDLAVVKEEVATE